MPESERFYVPSLSSRTIVYKGLLLPEQIPALLPRPRRPALRLGAGARAPALLDQHLPVVGPRAPVPLHRPQRRDQHAARQRQLDARAPGDVRLAAVRRRDASSSRSRSRRPATRATSTTRSSCCVRTGRSLPHAVMMMIPEAWQNHESMSDDEARLLRVPRLPAGAVGRPGVDRLHRRPRHRRRARPQRAPPVALRRHQGRLRRHGVRGRACSTSRPRTSCTRTACSPGRMFLVDTEQGRIVGDDEIKEAMAARKPYRAVARRAPRARSPTCRAPGDVPPAYDARHAPRPPAGLRLHASRTCAS